MADTVVTQSEKASTGSECMRVPLRVYRRTDSTHLVVSTFSTSGPVAVAEDRFLHSLQFGKLGLLVFLVLRWQKRINASTWHIVQFVDALSKPLNTPLAAA